MSDERAHERTPVRWPPFRPNLKLRADLEKGRSKEELEAALRELSRGRDDDVETAPEKST